MNNFGVILDAVNVFIYVTCLVISIAIGNFVASCAWICCLILMVRIHLK